MNSSVRRISICEEPHDPALSVHPCQQLDGTDAWEVVIQIGAGAAAGTKNVMARMQKTARFAGTVRAHLWSLTEGRLPRASNEARPDGSFLPVASQPDIWEVRYPSDLGKYRSYHSEPPELQQVLVLLHFHEKQTTSLTSEAIKQAQNHEMSVAQNLHTTGIPTRWGHMRPCSHCQKIVQ